MWFPQVEICLDKGCVEINCECVVISSLHAIIFVSNLQTNILTYKFNMNYFLNNYDTVETWIRVGVCMRKDLKLNKKYIRLFNFISYWFCILWIFNNTIQSMRRTKSRITIINPHILTDQIQQRINNTSFVFVHHLGTILIKSKKT